MPTTTKHQRRTTVSVSATEVSTRPRWRSVGSTTWRAAGSRRASVSTTGVSRLVPSRLVAGAPHTSGQALALIAPQPSSGQTNPTTGRRPPDRRRPEEPFPSQPPGSRSGLASHLNHRNPTTTRNEAGSTVSVSTTRVSRLVADAPHTSTTEPDQRSGDPGPSPRSRSPCPCPCRPCLPSRPSPCPSHRRRPPPPPPRRRPRRRPRPPAGSRWERG